MFLLGAGASPSDGDEAVPGLDGAVVRLDGQVRRADVAAAAGVKVVGQAKQGHVIAVTAAARRVKVLWEAKDRLLFMREDLTRKSFS